MPTLSITVSTRDNRELPPTVEVEARTVPGTKGLAIHPTVYGPSDRVDPSARWTVTHINSGISVLQTRRRATATGAVRALAAFDWEQPAENLRADVTLRNTIYRFRKLATDWERNRQNGRGIPPPEWWEAS